jgi:hypothetical protein
VKVKYFFFLLLASDLVIIFAIHSGGQAWASAVCRNVGGLCDHEPFLEVVGVLAAAFAYITKDY